MNRILIQSLIMTFTFILSAQAKIKIACVGDSITYGSGIKQRDKFCYPAQLQSLLGDGYEVKNFGVSGATMLNKADKPYTKQKAYQDSLSFEPNIVLIKLGTNDAKKHNWEHGKDYLADAKALVESYQNLPTKPRVILCKPAPAFGIKFKIIPKVARREVGAQLDKLAIEKGLEVIDLYYPLADRQDLLPDKIHPNAAGAKIMASHIHRVFSIPTEQFQAEVKPKKTFYSYPLYQEKIDNFRIYVATPRQVAKGKPWIWRARFWGHQSQADIQLLELGFHVVYCDVTNLFGAPSAVDRWNKCYAKTQELGLNPKAILEGMSRGGLIIHNWAVANPEKVAGIIGDNCVMDIKSWPAGFGEGKGHAPTWILCKEAYGFKSDEEAKQYKLNPIETIEKITANNIPLLYLIGEQDKVVPPNENSLLASQKIKGYEHIKIISKPKFGHHPHSLPNPKPITEFALQCYELHNKPAEVAEPAMKD